jgi:uncharacterized protein YdhG (YjbR/CyaY superfamily)
MTTRNAKKPGAKTTHPKTVADYIAAAPKEKRATLLKLRRIIKAAAPKANESVSYGIVGLKYNGKALVYFGYWKSHYALYGFSSSFIDAHADELRAHGLSSKGTLRFTADRPLPDRLVTKIVKARIAEIDGAG